MDHENQELLDKNNKMQRELRETLDEQRAQMAEIEAGLKELGLDMDMDLLIDSLTPDQQAQISDLEAEINRLDTEFTDKKPQKTKPTRFKRNMV